MDLQEPYAVAVTAVPPAAPAPSTSGSRRLLLLLGTGAALVGTALGVRAALPAPLAPLRALDEPAPAAQGWGPTYVDAQGRPARWDPCTPIHYVVRAADAPQAGRRDLAGALARISAVSGLSFVDDGDTDEVPSAGRAAYQPDRYPGRWAPLLVGWVAPSATDVGLEGDVQGVTLSVALPGRDGGSIVTGQVALDAGSRLPSGFGPGSTEGEVLLHELAHAVGLGHVADPTQVMWTSTTNAESQFGAGDRAGLVALGRSAGCRPAPDPRPLG